MTARKTTPVLALLCLLVPLLILAPAAALATEQAAHGGGGGIVMDTVKRVLNFGILMGVLVYFLRKPVGDFFRGRRAQIAQQLADLERARDEARVQLKGFENKLAQAAAERDKIMAEFIAQAEVEKSRILAEAEANANRIKDAARLTIEADLKAAKRGLREELAEAAVELAAKKLEAGIKVDDHNRLIDEYLTKVVALK